MNDPHVVSLTYRIDMADTVDFDRAPPKTVDQGAFRVMLDAGEAKIEMVDHFASVEEAKQVVAPFLRAWELEMDLRDAGDASGSRTRRPKSSTAIHPRPGTPS